MLIKKVKNIIKNKLSNNVKFNISKINEIKRVTDEKNISKRHELIWNNCEIIRHYLSSFKLENASTEFTKQYVNDALPRFLNTLDLLPFKDNLKVLEIGANPYLFSILMKKFHNYDIKFTNFFSHNIYEKNVSKGNQKIKSELYNEEYEFDYDEFNIELSDYPYQPDSFDLILLCETLEHLVINPLTIFNKIKSILKTGGKLLITVPNAVRLVNIANILYGSNFFDRYHPENGVYGRHNREFTIEEFREILVNNGFKIIELKTLDRYDYNLINIMKDNYEKKEVIPYTKDKVMSDLTKIGARLTDRGDNIYVVAEKI